MTLSVRYFVELDLGGTHGRLHQGNPDHARILPDLQLGPTATVRIKGKDYQLGQLVQALIAYQQDDLREVYDERGQLELGQYLYAQLFGSLDTREMQRLHDAKVEVQIVTIDEHLARLPWVLLADRGVFLSTAGWAVTLTTTIESDDCELSPSPRILVVAPQPTGVATTQAEPHLEKLEELLSGADPRHSWGRNLRRVETWETFTQTVTEFQPQIVYYYGHGIGDVHSSKLVFATGKQHQRIDKPIADVAACLRQMPGGPPLLAYLNCCQGDAGGVLGAGLQLGNFIPAVVTNRTVAHIDAAQAQGLAFWRRVVLDGMAPHTAVAEMYTQVVNQDLSLSDARWMTPVLHRHYATWKANPPRSNNELSPHWQLRLDRVPQISQVTHLTRLMLREQRPRTLSYVWYGQEGQGVDLFHQRLPVEFREDLPGVSLYEVLPEWPVELVHPGRSFTDMLTAAFDVNHLGDIPARIRAQTRGASGRQTLVYVRHTPVRSAKAVINAKTFGTYLEWWDTHFAPLLDGQVFAVLGVSFVVKEPSKFDRVFTERERIHDLPLSRTVFKLLDVMKEVAKSDLRDFLRTHNIAIPLGRIDKLLDAILAKTGGHYEATLEELKDIAARAWAEEEQEARMQDPGAEDDEY